MATTYKALEMANELADALKKRSALTLLQGFDTDSSPTILMGSGATTTASMFIKVAPTPWALAKDSLGNAAIQYTPHVVQVVTEKSVIGTGAGDYLTLAQLVPLIGECLSRGCRFEWYQSNNATGPSAAGITGTPKASYEPSLYWPMISNQ